ncbi:Probable cinnamyl alcohol dehydrogenase 9, partial [Linum perenne]
TVSAVHSLAPLLALLKPSGKLITLGLPDKPLELPIFPLVLGSKAGGRKRHRRDERDAGDARLLRKARHHC